MKKTVFIKTLGCKVNSYESEFIRSLFLCEGYEINEEASVYVVNTCTVTNNADKKSKKVIKSIRNNHPNSILIVMGCFCQNKKENILEHIDADIILGNKDKSKVIDYLNEFIKNKKQIIKFYDINKSVPFEDMEITIPETKTRAFVKIEDGCNNFCSYCIIPYVRGRVRSKSKDIVLNEIKHLVDNSHKEVILTGIHTGQYDDNGYRLYNLINDICKYKLDRVRLSSVEVVELNTDMLETLKNNDKFVSHLHIPLQSGCDKILKLMNRRYDTAYFKDKINNIRKIRPNISITTDVIVGFPGETEEEFKETLKFCKSIKFSKIHVFPYSDRTGTVASTSKDKVLEITKKERVKRLMDLSLKMEKDYYEFFIGKELPLLIETKDDEYCYGHTDNYIKLKVKGNYNHNDIVIIKVKKEMFCYEVE